MSEIKYIGQMSSSQNSRVIDPEGISYAVTNGHKDGEPKIIEPIGCAMRGRNPENPSERGRSNGKYKQRIEMGSNISNTITSVQKDSLVAEPNVLTPKRTDFGKQVRKQYESGELDMSRHDMTELEPRTDGVSNTLTSVQKDNLVAEPMVYDDYNSKFPQDQNIIGTITTQIGNPAPRHGFKIVEGVSVHPNSHALEFKGQESIKQDAAPSLRATDYKAPHCVWEKSPSYRIRKLTPRECFRLMGVTEADIDKIQQSGVSQSQQYKMAGNSIVVDCLYHMFRKMFTETACESQQLSLF